MSKNSNIKERTCIGCRTKKQKEELARFSKNGAKYYYDPKGKNEGRGIYICKDISCIEKGIKNKTYAINESEINILKKDILQNQ